MGLFAGDALSVAERLARRGFYIPSGVALSETQADAVVTAVQELMFQEITFTDACWNKGR